MENKKANALSKWALLMTYIAYLLRFMKITFPLSSIVDVAYKAR